MKKHYRQYWSTSEHHYLSNDGTYCTTGVSFHGPGGLHATVEFLDYNGKPSIKVRASQDVPVDITLEPTFPINAGDEEEAI